MTTNASKELSRLTRGALEVVGREELEKKLAAGKRLTVKHGVDATARDLHLGYAVCYQVMRRFQDAGHKVVLLIGDFTTRIGDPTGKDTTRPQLSLADIEANITSMLEQVGAVLDLDSLVIRRNSEWFNKKSLADLLSLGTKISAAQLWDREMFRKRLEQGESIRVHELLYPILQGYDSYELDSDITINGTDQRFNELMGRQIQSLYGRSPQAIALMPLLVGTDGKQKMGQSLGNYIGLRESGVQQYGKVMSIPDDCLRNYYELCTTYSDEELAEVLAAIESGDMHPMEAKMRLARRIVQQYHGEQQSCDAEAEFERIHRERQAPSEVEECVIPRGELPLWICRAMKDAGLTAGTSEARRLIEDGAIRLDGEKVTDIDHKFTEPGAWVLQRGRRKFVRLVIS
jgi:tyrosyl-tRNA synthetase